MSYQSAISKLRLVCSGEEWREEPKRGNEGSEKKREVGKEGGRGEAHVMKERRTRREQSRRGIAAPIREIRDGSFIYSERNSSRTSTLLGNYFTEVEKQKKHLQYQRQQASKKCKQLKQL